MEFSHDAFGALFERKTLALALRAMSEHPLAELLSFVERGDDPRARQLGELTLRELADPPECGQRALWAPFVDGADFDAFMLELLRELHPRAAKAADLRAQLGGPRWKLRASLERLEAQGLVVRSGMTSDTSYLAVR